MGEHQEKPNLPAPLMALGIVLLSFLAQFIFQTIWATSDKSRDNIGDLRTVVAGLSQKIDTAQQSIERQSVLIQQIFDASNARDIRLIKLEMNLAQGEKSLADIHQLISRQLERLEGQMQDLQKEPTPKRR